MTCTRSSPQSQNQTVRMNVRFVDMCHRSGYYAWRARPVRWWLVRRRDLSEYYDVEDQGQVKFDAKSDRCLWQSQCIQAELVAADASANWGAIKCTGNVTKCVCQRNLAGCPKRRFRVTTQRDPSHAVATEQFAANETVSACQRRSKISPPGRSKTSPLNVMRYAVLGGCPGSP